MTEKLRQGDLREVEGAHSGDMEHKWLDPSIRDDWDVHGDIIGGLKVAHLRLEEGDDLKGAGAIEDCDLEVRRRVLLLDVGEGLVNRLAGSDIAREGRGLRSECQREESRREGGSRTVPPSALMASASDFKLSRFLASSATLKPFFANARPTVEAQHQSETQR